MEAKKIKLPKGVTIHKGGQKYGGDVEIPADICPDRYLPKTKTSDSGKAK